MNDLDTQAFNALFREAYEKSFGYPLTESLSETESKLFYNKVFDQTGLVIGWKSLKNYSSFVVDEDAGKPENPSVATLDTLARYVTEAPYSSETERKEKESHYPYWFAYKEKIHRSLQPETVLNKDKTSRQVLLATIFFLAVGLIMLIRYNVHKAPLPFTDDFHELSTSSLQQRGWFLQLPDTVFWNRRNEKENQFTLFTLRGDNWPNAKEKIGIRNLLLRKITKDCFDAEIHLDDFLPDQNWKQAGILLLEDTNFTGKSLRLSIAYNDFFGGYHKPKEVIIQAISSSGRNESEPEEIAHLPIVFLDSIRLHPELADNMKTSALRIEKNGKKFRFLYAGGSVTNPAFKEVITHEYDMHPRYIGIFAMKGFVDSASESPVHFTFFRIKERDCE
jgi:hypothetical protein